MAIIERVYCSLVKAIAYSKIERHTCEPNNRGYYSDKLTNCYKEQTSFALPYRYPWSFALKSAVLVLIFERLKVVSWKESKRQKTVPFIAFKTFMSTFLARVSPSFSLHSAQ